MVRVAVVDPLAIVRRGVVQTLATHAAFEIVVQAATAEEVLVQLESTSVQLVVTDFNLPGMNGARFTTELLRRGITSVLVMTAHPNNLVVREALHAGALAVVAKTSDPAVLRSAAVAVARGEEFVDPSLAPALLALALDPRSVRGPFDLTPQEYRVVGLVARGLSNREIGAELEITEETVKSHVASAIRKLGAANRTEATAIAVRRGLA